MLMILVDIPYYIQSLQHSLESKILITMYISSAIRIQISLVLKRIICLKTYLYMSYDESIGT
jgi:hypothetical protein